LAFSEEAKELGTRKAMVLVDPAFMPGEGDLEDAF